VDDTRSCTGCHSIDRTLHATQPTGTEDNPCLQCHTDKIGLLAKDFVHGPVAGGTCTICHDPHGSQFARTLVSPVPVLCEGCHTGVSGSTLAVQHLPFAQGWCVDCHDPHATNHKWGLLRDSRDLCLGCHFTDASQRTHRHPYGVKPHDRKKLASHLKLGSDGKLECLTCHTPHASETAFLLRTNGENKCLGCHPERT
jgi:predicted CXXCH cytochrome family protein